jgi:hypothetical protein
MSDYIHIDKGALPWQPSADAAEIEVLHDFTIPLAGILQQHGVSYVFWCVVGHSGPENAWAYAHVDDAGLLEALRQSDHESFDDALRVAVKDRTCAFAIASDEKGVIEWVTLDPPADFDTAYKRGMEDLATKVNETMAEMQTMLQEYPALRAATSFSISPSPRLAPVE